MAIDRSAWLQNRIAQLVREVGLRIVRRSDHVLDCLSECGGSSYSFVLKPLGPGRLEIVLADPVGDERWDNLKEACRHANGISKDVLVHLMNAQMLALTEIPMADVGALTADGIHGRLSALHGAAAGFYQKLTEIDGAPASEPPQ